VPRRRAVVAEAAAASATSGSSERLYLSGSGPPAGWVGAGVTGMWVCSGSHSESSPRSSTARASSTTPIETSVTNIVTP